MPSLSLPEDASAAKKASKAAAFGKTATIGVMVVEEKKRKKKKAAEDGDATASGKKKSKDRKRKLCDEERSDTSSDHGEGVAPPPPTKKKKKASADVSDDDGEVVESGDDEEEEAANPNSVSNFRISASLRERLKSKGIEALFPIQAMTFDLILDGNDLVGRARTGQGKTLAFVLPILESLTSGKNKLSRRTGYGRLPSVLVLLPTRELACQVFSDFEFYGGAVGLTSCCLYGGSPYRPQENALHRGVDIVIGTPGRIKDHLERETLNLKELRFRVLDEADEMLNMGFVDDVELILGKVGDASTVQTLLFSATLPDWVKKISSRFLKPTKKTADLVGNDKLKASASVRHLVLPCTSKARAKLIPDIIRCYSSGGRTIIFTETKESASALAGLLPGARALHGDIVQGQREVILSGFRSGRFLILVATNVAARGLDINDVQLIIQCEPPRDVEAYIHRSGRTGRAGNNGVAILLYEPRYTHAISRIERETGVKFERISAPQPAEIAETAGSVAAEAISGVSDNVIPIFKAQAEQLLSSSGLSAVDLLAKALAKSAGYTEIKKRSLLSSLEDSVTLVLEPGRLMYTPSFAYGVLRRLLPEEKIDDLKGLALTADGMGAIFDVPTEDVDLFVKASGNGISIKELEELPPLQDKPQARGGFGGRGRFGGNGGGRGGGFNNRFGGGRGGGGNSFGNQSRGFLNTRGRGGRFRQ